MLCQKCKQHIKYRIYYVPQLIVKSSWNSSERELIRNQNCCTCANAKSLRSYVSLEMKLEFEFQTKYQNINSVFCIPMGNDRSFNIHISIMYGV